MVIHFLHLTHRLQEYLRWIFLSQETHSCPSLSKQLNIDTNFGGVTDNLGSLKEITDQAGEYTQDARQLVKGNLNEVKSIDKTLEARVTGMDELKPLQEGSALLASNKPDSAAMMDMAKEQLLNAAQDHFAGKQELLQQAMDKMNKLKSRYSEVQDMAALPKRLPNPLKGKAIDRTPRSFCWFPDSKAWQFFVRRVTIAAV